MRVGSRSMGLGVMLLLVVLLDSSAAQSVKKQKVTDPNYMHYVMNGGDATVTSYKHGYGYGYGSKPSKPTVKTTFTVQSCTVKNPGILVDTTGSPGSQPNAVSFW